ncbi:hypothetical protein FN846DRAFT_775552 [Sphaerosporella brunnea]|uniref:Uncharacterized protein n=1 Tax=Sphaerosporella brunnea TaxID=1250544 RepID=A0A5J5F267_9PEZI|nr:hypothetical protein FN846DRAFT_775552 [Sphaerosporella brunnea]
MTSEKVLRIWQLADVTRIPGLTKSIIWVEKGNNTAGLEHILRHAPDFEKEGVVGGDKLMELAEAATKVGRQGEKGQGKGGGRPIFGLSFHGQPLAVAISVGSNGYVVGMNPSSLEKFLAQNKLDEEALKEFHSWPAVTK